MPSIRVCWHGVCYCFCDKIDQIRFTNCSGKSKIGLLEVAHVKLKSISVTGLAILILNNIMHPVHYCLLRDVLFAPYKR